MLSFFQSGPRDPAGTQNIFDAIKRGDASSVTYWLEHGTDINAQDDKDWIQSNTPLIAP